MTDGISGRYAAELAGITYRQLDYWARTDLVRPSLADAHGSGSRRRYSMEDLLELRVIRSLLDAGLSLMVARDLMAEVRRQLVTAEDAPRLVVAPPSAFLTRSPAETASVIDGLMDSGVLTVTVVGLDHLRAELAEAVT